MIDSVASQTTKQPSRVTATDSWVDLAIVFTVSAVVFFLERWATDQQLINVPPASTGFTAVIAGCVAAVCLVFYRGPSWTEIGFRKPDNWRTVPFWVIGIFLVFVVAQVALPALVGMFIELPAADLSRYNSLYQNLPGVITMALLLPLTASIPEEIIYRGFLMDRLIRIFGERLPGLVLTVAVQSVIFGAIHFQWGWGGVLVATIMGVVWGTAFLLVGRNLWIVIMAHSLGHIAMVSQLYFVKGGELG